ncbi:MAG TPA: hypothetical protein ENJ23_02080, partial [Bacteroidetes bacterium]|nr:hypothetical protein [Bacteroidota bacterium]
MQLGALLVREADDIQHPLEGELTQEERRLLARIGDNLDSAFVQYGRYVGEGNGNFVRMDSAGVPVYRYVGPQNGDYQVRFSYVGDGRGQYRYVGGGEYRFVGEGKGNYSARRFLPVASTQSLGVLRLSWTPWKVWQLNGEVALSQADLNRFSSLDDEDNTGSAYQIQSRLQPLALRLGRLGLGKLQAGVTLRDQGDRFVPVSRYQEVEYSRKWDLPGDKSRGERVRELSAVYTAFPGVSLRLEGGSLRRGGSFRSTRKMLEAALKRKGLPELFYREERIGRDESVFSSRGSWIRRLGRAQVRLWRFTPRLRYEAEVKRDQRLADSTDAGFRFEDWTAGVALQVGGPLQISLERNLREDQTREPGTWQPSSHAEGLRYGLTLRRWHQLEMRLHVLNRQRTYSGDPARNRRTRLADFVLSFTPLQRAFTANVRFQMSTEQISRTEQIYFKVEDGRGMYRYDPDLREYVPDVFGDYILRTLATGEFESVNDALLNWNA